MNKLWYIKYTVRNTFRICWEHEGNGFRVNKESELSIISIPLTPFFNRVQIRVRLCRIIYAVLGHINF